MYSRIANDECLVCEQSLVRGMQLISLLLEDPLCFNCRKSLNLKIRRRQFEGHSLYTMYEYEHIKQHLIRFKDYLDIPLGHIFLKPYMPFLNVLFKGYTIVAIPSSESMIQRRGFHHLNILLSNCKLPIVSCLIKKDEIQRFQKNRDVVFTLSKTVSFDKVLIFDDVVTSGNSLKAALKVLRPLSSKIVLLSIANNYRGGD